MDIRLWGPEAECCYLDIPSKGSFDEAVLPDGGVTEGYLDHKGTTLINRLIH